MRWKQNIPARPDPRDIRKLTLPRALALAALILGAFMAATKLLNVDVPLAFVLRIAIIGILATLAILALKSVRDLTKKATPLLWVALLILSGINLYLATKPTGVNVARAAIGETGLVVSWVCAVALMPDPKKNLKYKRLQNLMPLLPVLLFAIPILTGAWLGTAELPESGQHVATALNDLAKQNGPGATADLASGIGASLADAWRSLWSF